MWCTPLASQKFVSIEQKRQTCLPHPPNVGKFGFTKRTPIPSQFSDTFLALTYFVKMFVECNVLLTFSMSSACFDNFCGTHKHRTSRCRARPTPFRNEMALAASKSAPIDIGLPSKAFRHALPTKSLRGSLQLRLPRAQRGGFSKRNP